MGFQDIAADTDLSAGADCHEISQLKFFKEEISRNDVVIEVVFMVLLSMIAGYCEGLDVKMKFNFLIAIFAFIA